MDIERLTARNKDGFAYLVNVKPDEQEVNSPHKNTLKCILDCFERLALYEDTGLEPEKISAAIQANADFHAKYDSTIPWYKLDHAAELLAAEQDGRVVVLPTLDTGIIRRMDDLGRVVIPKIVRSKLGLCADNYPPMMIIGCEDGIFLREYRTEAEAALARDGGHDE